MVIVDALAIVLILLTLCGRLFGDDPAVLRWTMGFTLAAAVLELLRSLPAPALEALHLTTLTGTVTGLLPLAELGFGWVLPAAAGLAVGLLRRRAARP